MARTIGCARLSSGCVAVYRTHYRRQALVYFRVDEPFYADLFADVEAVLVHIDQRLWMFSGLA